MDIRKPCSFLRLFIEGFNLVNKSFGTILVLGLSAVAAYILLAILTVLCKLPAFFVSLVSAVLSNFLTMMLLRLFTARAENDNISLPDMAIAAVMPTINIVILSFLCGIAGLIFALPFYSNTNYPFILNCLIIAVGLFVSFRLVFASMAIAVREQGPISSLKYSWHLTGRHWMYTLGALFLMALFPILFVGTVLLGLYAAIPLFFAEHFSLLHLSAPWIIFLLLVTLLFICVEISMCAYFVLVFLHLDYEDNRGPLPAEPMPQTEATPALQPASDIAKEELQVEQASVKSHADDESVSQHLDQVYQPKQDVVEYAEEDRMPTILFDDDMAKEIEQTRQQWEQEKARAQRKDDDDSEPSTIKMSR